MARKHDVWFTPELIAKYMIEYFKPEGRILDPCAGDGAFLNNMPGADWCEITKGRDFYDFDERVDWVFGNPPYSIFSDFLRHSFKIANNICYLIPANKTFNSYKMMKEIQEYGGIVEIHVIAPGSKLHFPIGFCIAAVHIKRGFKGKTKISYMESAPKTPNLEAQLSKEKE